MPELPEVETVVRDLRPLLCGKRIAGVRVGKQKLRMPWKNAWARKVAGQRIIGIRRRGKWIIVELESEAQLLIHLGMTGQLTVRADDEVREEHTHLVFRLDEGKFQLRFRDIRRFGSVQYVTARNELERALDQRLGPEPWDLDAERWHASWKQSRRALKAILLDQLIVAGVGNIYADEALFAAGLSPLQTGRATTLEQAERLRGAVIQVFENAISARGTSISDYVGGSGLRGGFQDRLQVYGRAGLPCVRCGGAVVCIRLAGRSTHYCPNCQKKAGRMNRRPANCASEKH